LGWTSFTDAVLRVSPAAMRETRRALVSNGNLTVTSKEKSLNVETETPQPIATKEEAGIILGHESQLVLEKASFRIAQKQSLHEL